jgi:hypothetical protein
MQRNDSRELTLSRDSTLPSTHRALITTKMKRLKRIPRTNNSSLFQKNVRIYLLSVRLLDKSIWSDAHSSM